MFLCWEEQEEPREARGAPEVLPCREGRGERPCREGQGALPCQEALEGRPGGRGVQEVLPYRAALEEQEVGREVQEGLVGDRGVRVECFRRTCIFLLSQP